jgi:hypothetical protein
MTTNEGFAYLTSSVEGGTHLDSVTAHGVQRITFHPAPPCDPDCLCSSLLVEGVLYGPATWEQCTEAIKSLRPDLDFTLGVTSELEETEKIGSRQPLVTIGHLFGK